MIDKEYIDIKVWENNSSPVADDAVAASIYSTSMEKAFDCCSRLIVKLNQSITD